MTGISPVIDGYTKAQHSREKTMPETRTMTVGRIDDQGDRLLLYPASRSKDHFKFQLGKYTFGIEITYVIASVKERENIRDGDTILYEPAGGNFGWFVSKSP